MDFRERVTIAKKDGGGTSIRCSKHGIKMQVVSIGTTHAQVACPKCHPELFK